MGQVNHDTALIWEGWQLRQFRAARCVDCQAWLDGPRALCPQCWSERIEYTAVDGGGGDDGSTGARDLPHRPVFIDASASRLPRYNDGRLYLEADGAAARRAVEHLFARTDYSPRDVDVSYPYDGFSILTMLWLEALYTEEGGGPELIRESWSDELQQLRLFGRVPVCTHGGNLSEGRATQGFGHVLEAAHQLRGTAGERQVAGDPRTAVVTNGAAFSNRSALLSFD